MPCSEKRARILLGAGRAVVQGTPHSSLGMNAGASCGPLVKRSNTVGQGWPLSESGCSTRADRGQPCPYDMKGRIIDQ